MEMIYNEFEIVSYYKHLKNEAAGRRGDVKSLLKNI